MRLVLGQHDRPAGQFYQPGHDPGRHVVMARVATGVSVGRQIATSWTRRYSVCMLTGGWPRYRQIAVLLYWALQRRPAPPIPEPPR